MTQTPRDAQFQLAFGQRLGILVEQHLEISLSELAGQLGYRNESALRKVRKGLACLSAEKLAALAALPVAGHAGRISVDWLLTGYGSPLESDSSIASTSADALDAHIDVPQRVAQAPASLQQTIAHFLDVQEGRPVRTSPPLARRTRAAPRA